MRHPKAVFLLISKLNIVLGDTLFLYNCWPGLNSTENSSFGSTANSTLAICIHKHFTHCHNLFDRFQWQELYSEIEFSANSWKILFIQVLYDKIDLQIHYPVLIFKALKSYLLNWSANATFEFPPFHVYSMKTITTKLVKNLHLLNGHPAFDVKSIKSH